MIRPTGGRDHRRQAGRLPQARPRRRRAIRELAGPVRPRGPYGAIRLHDERVLASRADRLRAGGQQPRARHVCRRAITDLAHAVSAPDVDLPVAAHGERVIIPGGNRDDGSHRQRDGRLPLGRRAVPDRAKAVASPSKHGTVARQREGVRGAGRHGHDARQSGNRLRDPPDGQAIVAKLPAAVGAEGPHRSIGFHHERVLMASGDLRAGRGLGGRPRRDTDGKDNERQQDPNRDSAAWVHQREPRRRGTDKKGTAFRAGERFVRQRRGMLPQQ